MRNCAKKKKENTLTAHTANTQTQTHTKKDAIEYPLFVNEGIEFSSVTQENQKSEILGTISDEVSNTKWTLGIIDNKHGWFGIILTLDDKPDFIKSIQIRAMFAIENKDLKFKHVRGIVPEALTNKDNFTGTTAFIPIEVLQELKQTQIQCKVFIDKINDLPFHSQIKLFNQEIFQSLCFC